MDKFNLTDVEKEALIAFKDNEVMFDAVQKVLLSCIYANGVVTKGVKHDSKQNWALATLWNTDRELSDSELANSIRATAEGIRFIESGLQEIRNLKKETAPVAKVNKAL